jgi:RNA polymerase sigma-70 factor (ECF subfamily)
MSLLSDRELIAAAAQGQVAAFATLVGRYRDARTRFAIRMLGSAEAADDALQSAFLRAFRSIVRYKAPEPFADWLFRIIINECRARALRRAVRERRVLTGEFEAIPNGPAKFASDEEDQGQRALNQIDPINREPFILQYIEEMSLAQIATLTGATVVTLERQVDRACARLRELLPHLEKEDVPAGGLIQFDDVGPSFPVRVALPLRRAEVLNDSFEDRLMSKLLRPGEAADAIVAPDQSETKETFATDASRPVTPVQSDATAMNTPTPPMSPWTQQAAKDRFRVPTLSQWAPAAIGAVVALAAYGAGYGMRGRKDAHIVAAAKTKPKQAAPRIVRRTDTLRVATSDTLVIARFVFADPSARSVSLVGDFNHWDASATPLTKTASGAWATTLKLKPARYEYVFQVDGKRMVTDKAARTNRDQFDGQSSILSLVGATTPGSDATASARLKKLLPRATAERVLATIATARNHGLPAAALENHALKFVAEHVAPKEIDRVIAGESARMTRASAMFASVDRREPTGDEITAGAELLTHDADSTSIPAVAKAASATRSLAVPLRVSAELIASNVSAHDALAKVQERLRAGASDAQLERLADDAATRSLAKGKGKGRETHVAKSSSSTASVKQAGTPAKGKASKKHKPS